MADTKQDNAPADGDKQRLPSVPGHLQEAVQQLVESNKPKRAGKNPSEERAKESPKER